MSEGVQKDSEVGSVGRGIVLEGLLESEVGKSRKGRMGIGGYGRIWEDMAREVGRRVQSNSEVRRMSRGMSGEEFKTMLEG